MSPSLLWAPATPEGLYDPATVSGSTHYRAIMRRLEWTSFERIEDLSDALNEVVRDTPFSRWRLFFGAGEPVRLRMAGIERVLEEHLGPPGAGGKIEWRVTGTNIGTYVKGGVSARLAAVLSMTQPVVWIRILL